MPFITMTLCKLSTIWSALLYSFLFASLVPVIAEQRMSEYLLDSAAVLSKQATYDDASWTFKSCSLDGVSAESEVEGSTRLLYNLVSVLFPVPLEEDMTAAKWLLLLLKD